MRTMQMLKFLASFQREFNACCCHKMHEDTLHGHHCLLADSPNALMHINVEHMPNWAATLASQQRLYICYMHLACVQPVSAAAANS